MQLGLFGFLQHVGSFIRLFKLKLSQKFFMLASSTDTLKSPTTK